MMRKSSSDDRSGSMATLRGRIRSAEQLGQMLQQGRLIRGVSQRELASQLGVSQRYIHEMESGKPTKYALRLFEIMRATGATMSIEIDGEPPRG
ncbi:helix-turn-helix domain-containing protein [Frigoribacterium sp. VKM Ac-1396]|uniref:helix-turn-helix domain-containing protein n=1 Tax=Frigoribacterium sp. VKM Ac-1396 TaxID=2783821 RepID=UPI00351C1431